MITGFEDVVEQRIRAAQKKGEMDNLPGSGKPLNLEDMAIPEEYRMAHRVLKNAGFLPPEVSLRKKIESVETLLASLPAQAPERPALHKKLNLLMARLAAARGSRRKCTIPGAYQGAVEKRIV